MSSSIIKETERINKLFKPYADSFLKIQSQLDSSLYSSVLEAQRHIETTVAGTLQRFREQFKMSWVDSAQKTYEKLEVSLRPFQQLQSRIDSSLHSSILEAHRQLETTVAGTAARLHDQLAGSWAVQIRQVQDSLRKSINVPLLHENMELINDRFDQFNKLFSGINFEDFAVNQDGTVALSGESVALTDINETVLSILGKDEEKLTFQLFFDKVSEKLHQLKKPIQAIILYLLLPYFISIFAGLSTPYFSNIFSPIHSPNKQLIIKEIKKNTIATFPFEKFVSFRFVKADILNVRNKSTIKSEKIDNIYFGQVVQIIEKRRNWSLVEYFDTTTGEVVTGWVFTRYLERFKK